MKTKTLNWIRTVLIGLTLAGSASLVMADASTEALLQILVRKGYLTEAEAAEVRDEMEAPEASTPVAQAPEQPKVTAPFTSSGAVPEQSELAAVAAVRAQEKAAAESSDGVEHPIQVGKNATHLTLLGDFRVRYQYDKRELPNQDTNGRDRWRYRARIGGLYEFGESGFAGGLAFETSNDNDSTNATFGGFWDKTDDTLYISRAFITYTDERYHAVLGRAKSIFNLHGRFWDSDMSPEGVAGSVTIGDFLLRGSAYIIDVEDESREQSGDPDHGEDYLFMFQVEKKFGGLTVAPIFMTMTDGTSTNAAGGDFEGSGANTYFDNFLVFALPAEYKFKLAGVPQKVYGTWGINLKGDDAMNDPTGPYYAGSEYASHNQFFLAGYQFGDAKKQGDHRFNAEYTYMEAASYTLNLSDSDFGLGNSLNLHGLRLQYRYMVTDFMQVSLLFEETWDIDSDLKSTVAPYEGTSLFQADVEISF